MAQPALASVKSHADRQSVVSVETLKQYSAIDKAKTSAQLQHLAFLRGGNVGPPPPSGITTFTPLHTYFMSPTGSDANNGTSAATPWLTPNHAAIVCGDVLISAAGTYNTNNLQVTTTPGTCPSVSGGIDGAGGIYAAIILCAGNVGTCKATDANNSRSFQFTASYWSVQGWAVTNPGDGVAFAQDCTSNTTFHHISFINDLAYDTGAGYSFGTCGGTGSADYYAVVGSIAWKANTHSACTSAFNYVVPKNFDTVAGTHIYSDTNYGIANPGNAGCTSDGNGLIIDSPDILSYTQQIVLTNHLIYSSKMYGLHIFSQETHPVTPIIKVLNNTVYNSGTSPVSGSAEVGEFTQSTLLFAQTTQNNIGLTGASSRAGTPLYAMLSGPNSNAVIGGTGTENIFKGSAGACAGAPCDAGNNVSANGGSIGTNTYTDPLFTNTTDLLANQVGQRDCTAFENVTQCMGYDITTNPASPVLTTPSVISDLQAACATCAGKGYQRPTACAPNALFPVWLKGLVYLHWTGSGVQQKQGLATVPCGL